MDKKPNSKASILNNAILLFYENGFANTTLTEIGKRSGVAHTAIYNFYKDKSDIGYSVMSRYLESLFYLAQCILDENSLPQTPDNLNTVYWLTHFQLLTKDRNFARFDVELATRDDISLAQATARQYFRLQFADMFGYEYVRNPHEYITDDLIISHTLVGFDHSVAEGFLSPQEAVLKLSEIVKAVSKIKIRVNKKSISDLCKKINLNRVMEIDVLNDMLLTKRGKELSN